jgi:hypothetical protein
LFGDKTAFKLAFQTPIANLGPGEKPSLATEEKSEDQRRRHLPSVLATFFILPGR